MEGGGQSPRICTIACLYHPNRILISQCFLSIDLSAGDMFAFEKTEKHLKAVSWPRWPCENELLHNLGSGIEY
jgi:hypothetical protein